MFLATALHCLINHANHAAGDAPHVSLKKRLAGGHNGKILFALGLVTN